MKEKLLSYLLALSLTLPGNIQNNNQKPFDNTTNISSETTIEPIILFDYIVASTNLEEDNPTYSDTKVNVYRIYEKDAYGEYQLISALIDSKPWDFGENTKCVYAFSISNQYIPIMQQYKCFLRTSFDSRMDKIVFTDLEKIPNGIPVNIGDKYQIKLAIDGPNQLFNNDVVYLYKLDDNYFMDTFNESLKDHCVGSLMISAKEVADNFNKMSYYVINNENGIELYTTPTSNLLYLSGKIPVVGISDQIVNSTEKPTDKVKKKVKESV